MSKYKSVKAYVDQVPDNRKPAFKNLMKTIKANIDPGFQECISYNMLGWVVPKSSYPDGYHCSPELPLPFANLANQKGYIALYHSGLYADEDMQKWFVTQYPNHAKRKLNIGKSCIRFKYMDDIPYELIGMLMSKMTVDMWIQLYEKAVMR